MQDLGDGGLPRPRASSWGSPADRALLQAIAEDLTRRVGFKVCAIEVLRSDLMLEFAAIAGSPEGSERLMGQGSPLESMSIVFDKGWNHHGWTFVAGKQLDEETQAVLSEYGHMPDYVPADAPDAWLPEDMLFSRLLGTRGELRALLYFDEPLSGRRPSAADIEALDQKARVSLESIVGIVERETYGEQMRMIDAARDVIRSQRSRLTVDELLSLVAEELPGGFRASRVAVTLAGSPPDAWHQYFDVFTEVMEKIWRRGGELIIDPENVWGDDDLAQAGAEIREFLRSAGIDSAVAIPFGLGDEFTGVLSMARGPGMPRWNDSEIQGGHIVAEDIAGALADARVIAREKRLNKNLLAVDEYRRTLLSTIAHELQNPVGVLTGHLDLIAMAGPAPEQERSLAAMERATSRIDSLAQNLVTLSKVSDVDRPLPGLTVTMTSLINELLEFTHVLAEGRGVTLRGEIAEGVRVRGDGEELHRVVNNLIGNAIKYTDPGGSVDVRLAAVDDTVELSVSDTGLGIAQSDVDQLFTAFFRSSNPRARVSPGTGLGLTIVKQVVDRHNGSIEVDSTLGRGTTFRVLLPLAV